MGDNAAPRRQLTDGDNGQTFRDVHINYTRSIIKYRQTRPRNMRHMYPTAKHNSGMGEEYNNEYKQTGELITLLGIGVTSAGCPVT